MTGPDRPPAGPSPDGPPPGPRSQTHPRPDGTPDPMPLPPIPRPSKRPVLSYAAAVVGYVLLAGTALTFVGMAVGR